MNCHMVPQCYLKSWKIPSTKESVYLFKKNKTIAYDNKRISKLKDTNFALKDKYILDFHSKEYMHRFYIQFSMLTQELNVTPYFNDRCIDNENTYIDCLDVIDYWEFRNNSTGKLISYTILESKWNKEFGKTIEAFISRHIENEWPKIVEYTNTHIMKRSWKVQAKYNDILIDFLIIQLLRRQENMEKMGLNYLINFLADSFTLPDGENSHDIFGGKFKEALWLFEFYKYTQYEENPIKENDNAITSCINAINKVYQICFLVASEKTKFITSDNPCYVIKTSKYGLTSGIYLPINTKVCLFLCNCKGKTDISKYYVLDICEQNVKYINQITKSNSFQELAYFDKDISNMFSKNIDFKSWEKMLTPLFEDLKL